MKGYHSFKQFLLDYKLYRAARRIEPGREGTTITSLLKDMINQRLAKASSQFKKMMQKNNYSKDDLFMIATHDTLREVHSLERFVFECFDCGYQRKSGFKKVLASNAFKSGRLELLYCLIPRKIETKNDLLRFIKIKREISKAELETIMRYVCKNDWRAWLDDLISKKQVQDNGTRWFA